MLFLIDLELPKKLQKKLVLMKMVHSFWSKPSLEKKTEKIIGGWRHTKYLYMSWTLSCLTIKKVYGNISLVTDINGYKLLIEKLKLPYTDVKVELDCLNRYPANLWAIGKLYSYSIQEEPFIHVDGDVYIWERFGKRIEKAGLLAQELDIDLGHYSFALSEIRKNKFYLPDIMEKDLKKSKRIESCNAGIIGGNDIEFIKKYCVEAFKLIDSNGDNNNLNYTGSSYALLYEQYLFSCLARKEAKKITFYLGDDLSIRDENSIEDVSDFMNKYNKKNRYVHLLSAKKNLMNYCYELENQLQLEYPNYYELICSLFP